VGIEKTWEQPQKNAGCFFLIRDLTAALFVGLEVAGSHF
jgi:hypothetical protein